MTAVMNPGDTSTPIAIPLWSWAVLLVSLLGSYLILQENGLILEQWETLHEYFHDGRHVFGLPCH